MRDSFRGERAHLATFLPIRHERFFRHLLVEKNLVGPYPLDILNGFGPSRISMRKRSIIFFLAQKGQDLHHVLPAIRVFLFPEGQDSRILHMSQPHVIGGQRKERPVGYGNGRWDSLLHDREVSCSPINTFPGIEPIPDPQ